MPVNLNKPHLWKADVAASVDMYNAWFLAFAPKAFRETRVRTTKLVEATLKATDNLKDVSPELLSEHPEVLSTLRMSTCPPIAVDRLIGLAGVDDNLVKQMEGKNKKKKNRLPPNAKSATLTPQLERIGDIIERLADPDIFVWLPDGRDATEDERHRAAIIVADRLCGSEANPIIRNEQEKRQLAKVKDWLEARGYQEVGGNNGPFDQMTPGTFSFRTNVRTKKPDGKNVQIPVDAVIMPKDAASGDLPLLIEAKSAGDYTNTNKRRKEEVNKVENLRRTYGADRIRFALFLCGYFDSGPRGYGASEGIDWVWEHRIDDLAGFGL